MIAFASILTLPRGSLARMLKDAYSFDPRCIKCWGENWRAYDDFFFDHPAIAETCGFVTVFSGVPVGHITWDPRNLPARAILGHNCILTAYKGQGLGGAQLREAVRRIAARGAERIDVTTSEMLIAAQRNYESAGFRRIGTRPSAEEDAFAGRLIDYTMTRQEGSYA